MNIIFNKILSISNRSLTKCEVSATLRIEKEIPKWMFFFMSSFYKLNESHEQLHI